MKTRTMTILIFVQLVITVLLLKWIIPDDNDSGSKTELLREISPDGDYVLLIERDVPMSESIESVEVTLYENTNNDERYSASFEAEILKGKKNADYKIEWLEEGVQVILSGVISDYYILPFKTLENS